MNTLTGIREQTFWETFIHLAFRKSGIIPLCPQVVLKKLKQHKPSRAEVQQESVAGAPQACPLLAMKTRPSMPDCLSAPATPCTVHSLKQQGESLLFSFWRHGPRIPKEAGNLREGRSGTGSGGSTSTGTTRHNRLCNAYTVIVTTAESCKAEARGGINGRASTYVTQV